MTKIMSALRGKPSNTLHDVLRDYIDDTDDLAGATAHDGHERILISNILKLRDLSVVDVMIPRADIVALELNTSQDDLLAFLSEKQFSRLPVYRETLDDVVGTIHIKDILAALSRQQPVVLKDLVRDVPIISPSMGVLDLLMQMRQTRKHMALVVDEYGGIDGLVTSGDIIEATIGELEDEFNNGSEPTLMDRGDGTVLADGRLDLESFEERFGHFLTEEEREDADTLGGLICSIAGHVPARGEVIEHESGIVFEIVEADPRRVHRVRVRNIPQPVSHA